MQPFGQSHVPVLLTEVMAALQPGVGKVMLDATLGRGSHTASLLELGCRLVVGLDRDPAALKETDEKLARYHDRFIGVHADYRDARAVLDRAGVGLVDGLLADLGVSSPQLDQPERGFSFGKPGPLDMRMDPTSGETLREWLERADEREIERVIREYGEEPAARKISRAVKSALDAGELTDTAALAKVVERGAGRRKPGGIHPATRTFQALRIAVNDELGALEALLEALPELVAPGGRAAIIAFHSLEDRPVKRRFQELSKGCICPPDLPVCGCGRTAGWRLVTRKAVVASDEETARNPRSRSARLRCIERLQAPPEA